LIHYHSDKTEKNKIEADMPKDLRLMRMDYADYFKRIGDIKQAHKDVTVPKGFSFLDKEKKDTIYARRLREYLEQK